MVTINSPHAYEVSRELIARNFLVDYRAGVGIRISPHFYNSDEEVRAVIRMMQAILDHDDWQCHAGQTSIVT